MNVKVPTLRKHCDGRWCTKWAGRYHYFGRDATKALTLYAENIKDWQQWRARRGTEICEPSKRPRRLTHICERFIASKAAEGGHALGSYYRRHLRRFVAIFGAEYAQDVRVAHLQALKDDMLKATREDGSPRYKPKTINHDLVASKGMLNWAMEQELVPAINLRGCRALRLPPPPNKAFDAQIVRAMIRQAPESVRPWLAVSYLTAARPAEVVRIIGGQCEWPEPGVCRVASKNDLRTGQPRHVVFSEIALAWLSVCERRFSRVDSYSRSVQRISALAPLRGTHRLRHSAATHLIQAGVARAEVDLILGHLPSRVSLTYAPINWQPLREKVALLTLSPSSGSG